MNDAVGITVSVAHEKNAHGVGRISVRTAGEHLDTENQLVTNRVALVRVIEGYQHTGVVVLGEINAQLCHQVKPEQGEDAMIAADAARTSMVTSLTV
jgi:hypothetical protein